MSRVKSRGSKEQSTGSVPSVVNAKTSAFTEPQASELSVPIGLQLLDVLEVAYRARRPVLLEGPTGVGKSQIAADLCKRLGIAFQVLDLSLLEPPDLVGLPVIVNGRTQYASPSELPSHGCGILLLEELNRAEIPVMQPALQLLSARRLHAYTLPPGWSCIAAINPDDGEYQVNRLDPALRSRFMQVSVCADRDSWLRWAQQANVHLVVMQIVHDHDDAFDATSPRSWAYASEILHTLTDEELRRPELVRIALRGYLPTAWSLVALSMIAAMPTTTLPAIGTVIAGGGDALASWVAQEQKAKRVDTVATLASRLRRFFATTEFVDLVNSGTHDVASLETLLAPLPGDLREQCVDSAVTSAAALPLLRKAHGEPQALLDGYPGSPLQSSMRTWRSAMTVGRIRLVVSGVMQWLMSASTDAMSSITIAGLRALTRDAGPLGGDIGRWLSAHGHDARGA